MMRIVLISEIFVEGMGYLENLLPKYLVRLGAEVHVVASSLPPDHHRTRAGQNSPNFEPDFAPGSVVTPLTSSASSADGFHLHILSHATTLGRVRLPGLARKLKELGPDIVQTMTPIGWIAVESAWNRLRLGYRLFSGCHYHASVFPLAQRKLPFFHPERLKCYFERWLAGRVVSWSTEKYYAIAPDCAEIARRFFGVPSHKIELCPLGVDTEVFHPVSNDEEREQRTLLRARLGFKGSEIVCVYSGRFGADKNPLLLARAVAKLASAGQPFRGLFIGNGPQAGEIAACLGCVTEPFVPMRELGKYYRAAEIGVWPAEESTSMLDSLACGLPLIANHTMHAPERLDGTGMHYRLGDLEDLVAKLQSLRRAETREKLGAEAARRMREEFNWEAIAARRIKDYTAALGLQQITAGKDSPETMDANQKRGISLPASGVKCE